MKKTFLFVLLITFQRFLIAGEQHTEPPILHKEIELKEQSQSKKAKEQAAQLKEEQRIAKEYAKAQAERAAEEKQVAAERERLAEAQRVIAERERLAKEAEAQRVAQEKAIREEEEKQLDDLKKGANERAKQRRLIEGQASPSDIESAKKFLARLPSACSSSGMSTSADGTVNIRLICNGSNQSMDGLISIKNGVLTHIE